MGVEPTTCRLRIGCSTTELPRPFIIQDLFPCQSYFRTASIKLPSNYHQTAALTGPEIGTVIGRLTICFPQRAGNDPETFPLAILAIRRKNALSFSLTIQKDRAAQQKRETTLKSVYRCPIPFASSWFYRVRVVEVISSGFPFFVALF